MPPLPGCTRAGCFQARQGGEMGMIYKKGPVWRRLGAVFAAAAMILGTVPGAGSLRAEAAQKDSYADVSGYERLDELYQDYFRFGAACEAISHWNDKNKEIGNPAKEELIGSVFNSITCGNEMKPAYNFDPESESLVSFNPAAEEMLDWAVEHDMGVRGHTLLWHSQVNPAVFAKNFEAYEDGKLTRSDSAKLDEECLVDRETLLARLKTYIYGMMEHIYRNGYARTIYAWDVVNEAADESNEDGLRRSYWYKIIGPDYLYYAFLYAREAETVYAKQYAAEYGLDAGTDDLSEIMPKLFYNDYNEWFEERSDKIVKFLTQDRWNENHAHVQSDVIAPDGDGTIYGDGLIDGIGMQGHLNDTQDIDQYMRALQKYSAAVDEVHITELDVGCSRTDETAWYYQAEFYYEFFARLIQEVESGAKLTSVTVWGLTDDASWRVDANPLLFYGNLDRKPAFDAVVMAAKGQAFDMTVADTLPEAGDQLINFEPYMEAGNVKNVELREAGILGYGTGHQATLKIAQKVNHTEGAAIGFALKVSRKEQDAGMMFDLSRYAGKTVTVTMHVKTEDRTIRMKLDTGSGAVTAAEADSAEEWTWLSAECVIPEDVRAAYIAVETDGAADFYVDDIEILCGESGSGPAREEDAQGENVQDDAAGPQGDLKEPDTGTETQEKNNSAAAVAAVVAAVVAVCAAAGYIGFKKSRADKK